MNGNNNSNRKRTRGYGIYFLVLLVVFGSIAALLRTPQTVKTTYLEVIQYFEDGRVREFVINDLDLTMVLDDQTRVSYSLPSIDIFLDDVGETIAEQRKAGIITDQDYVISEGSWLPLIVPYIVIALLFLAFWYFMISRQDGGAKSTMNFGKSRAKMVGDEGKRVSFKDVAGADEEKSDLEEVVEFLKAPDKFLRLGARIPKGVLLIGPPGTGKTLIAKAVAGEAGVPFFSISGSDFVELYVGVGASRVRDLFEQAKKNAPAIVFIDEIDAVGRRRGAGLGGGHDEREQTLNQLLVEMDGFTTNTGVIVIAATNRADILDPAMLRPGRFDRQIYIGLPDIKGRLEILKVHSRKKPFEKDVDFDAISRTTVGFTGADLENLLNEAALLAARRNKREIGLKDIDDAFMKVIMGNEKKSRVISEAERKLTAYHEGGHALVTRLLPSQDPVHQVSIIPRGRAGGFTMSRPREDKYYASRNEMLDELITLLGGRMAEKLVLDDISTGASNDIERATQMARKMVTRYGMSDKIGPINYDNDHDQVFLGRDFTTTSYISDSTAAQIDEEVKRIIDEAYDKAEEMLKAHMDTLHAVAKTLLERESIDGDEFEEIFCESEGLPKPEPKMQDMWGKKVPKDDEEGEPKAEQPDGERPAQPHDDGPNVGAGDSDRPEPDEGLTE